MIHDDHDDDDMCTVQLLLRGCSLVVRELELTSEDPGFDPLAGQGEKQFFLSLRVNSCADLFVPEPPFVCTTRTQVCATCARKRSHIHLSEMSRPHSW